MKRKQTWKITTTEDESVAFMIIKIYWKRKKNIKEEHFVYKKSLAEKKTNVGSKNDLKL